MTFRRRTLRRAVQFSTQDSKLTALAPFSWLRADNVLVSGGKVTAFQDLVQPSHTFAQANGANQSAAPTADATLGGALSVSFVAATVNYYISSLPAASWSFLHNGNGGEFFAVHVPTGTGSAPVVTTKNLSSAAEAGLGVYRAGSNYGVQIGNGTASIVDVSGVSATANGVARVLDISFATADSPDYNTRVSGSVTSSADASGTPSAGAPQFTVTIGARNSGALPADMRLADVIFFNRVLSAAERTIVNNYCLSRYGVF